MCASWKNRGACNGWERHQRCGFDHPLDQKGSAGPACAPVASQEVKIRRQEPRTPKRFEAKVLKEAELPEDEKAAAREARKVERAARHAEEAELEQMMAELRQEKETKRAEKGDDQEAEPSRKPERKKCPLCKKMIVPASFDAHLRFHAGK